MLALKICDLRKLHKKKFNVVIKSLNRKGDKHALKSLMKNIKCMARSDLLLKSYVVGVRITQFTAKEVDSYRFSIDSNCLANKVLRDIPIDVVAVV